MTRTPSTIAAIALALIALAGAARPALASDVTYQGRLEASGAAYTGAADLRYQLFTGETGGSPLATLSHSNAQVADGLFTSVIDLGPGLPASDVWLEISVRTPAGAGVFTTITPRQKLTDAPSATWSARPWSYAPSTDTVALAAGPASKVQLGAPVGGVGGMLELNNTAYATGMLLSSTSGHGALEAYSSGAGASTLAAYANAPGGIGLRAEGSGPSSVGVYGAATGVNSLAGWFAGTTRVDGSLGISTLPGCPLDVNGGVSPMAARILNSTPNAYGLWSQVTGPGSVAVFGLANDPAGFAGFFNGKVSITTRLGIGTPSPFFPLHIVARNVVAAARIEDHGPADGATYGLFASTSSFLGTAVYGECGENGATAVQGTHFGSGHAVTGFLGGANGVAVFGQTSAPATSFAGFFQGRTAATGTKSFIIDHPLDPANKTLTHYCSEGPEPLNVYQGAVVTDAAGYATVTLPDYFEALNAEARYQLTVVDGSDEFVLAKVVREIEGNQFTLRTSAGNVKVCWQVSGVRNDAFVRAYGAPVEADKPEDKRGTYLAPELYQGPAMHEAPKPVPAPTSPTTFPARVK